MKRIAIAAVISIVVIGLVCGHCLRSSPHPVLEVLDHHIDFGTAVPGQTLFKDIVIRNKGNSSLAFQGEVSCSCISVAPKNGTIVAGESRHLTIALRVPNHVGAQSSARLLLTTNDAIRPLHSIHVVGKAHMPFEVTPRMVDFGLTSDVREMGLSRTVTVTVPTGEQRMVKHRCVGDSFEVLQMESDKFQVSARSGSGLGDHHGQLLLFLDGCDESTVRIPLHIRVGPLFQIVPAEIRLMPTGDDERDLVAIGQDSLGAIGPLKIVEGPLGVSLEKVSAIDRFRHRYKLRGLSHLSKSASVKILHDPDGSIAEVLLRR